MRKGIRKKAKHDKSYLKELQKENRFKISLENRHQKGQVKGSNEKSQLLEMPYYLSNNLGKKRLNLITLLTTCIKNESRIETMSFFLMYTMCLCCSPDPIGTANRK